MRLVTIIGTDGSGKTSLSDQFANHLNDRGVPAQRVWLGAESHLMLPIRAFLRGSWSKNKSTPSLDDNYRNEVSRKNQLVAKFKYLETAYVAAVWFDYRIQLSIKMLRARKLDVIIADRYLFDVAVNMGLTLGWTPGEVVHFCQRKLSTMALPQARFFLRVSPEVSLSRKDDIPDVSYLQLRLSYYDAIANAFGFEILDGTRPLHENLQVLCKSTAHELQKPYVHYVHANNQDVGGADRVLALMAKHCASPSGGALPIRASVSLRKSTAAIDLHVAHGTPVIVKRVVRPQTSRGLMGLVGTAIATPRSFLYFMRLFGREDPDIVHLNDLYDVVPALAAKTRRIPVVYHIRMIKKSTLSRSLFRELIPRLSNFSVSVSGAVRANYFGTNGIDDTNALVIHDLGNEKLLTRVREDELQWPAPLLGLGNLVIMVGRIEHWKGQHLFLDAVEVLGPVTRAANTFALVGGVVPGSERYYEVIRSRARELGVSFLGEREDVPDLLSAADISVHCSVEADPFPGVVVESMMATTLTIGANSGGVPELITSGRVGLLFKTGDAHSLAEKIEIALDMDIETRRRIGERARHHVISLVDPVVIDQTLSSIYYSLAPHPRAGLLIDHPGRLTPDVV